MVWHFLLWGGIWCASLVISLLIFRYVWWQTDRHCASFCNVPPTKVGRHNEALYHFLQQEANANSTTLNDIWFLIILCCWMVIVIFYRQKFNTSRRLQKFLKKIIMEIFQVALKNCAHFLVRYYAFQVGRWVCVIMLDL